MAAVSVSVWTLLSVCYLVSASEEQTVRVDLGQNATLPCRAPNNNNNIILAVEWIRPDLGSGYVLLYRDKRYYSDRQHQSFKNRVELQDEQMNNGNVSLVLKNVTDEDDGRYECHVFQRGMNHRKIIYLKVADSGPTAGHREDGGNEDGGNKDGGNKHRHVGLGAALSVVGLIVVVVGFMFYRKHKGSTEQSSYQPPTEAVRTD